MHDYQLDEVELYPIKELSSILPTQHFLRGISMAFLFKSIVATSALLSSASFAQAGTIRMCGQTVNYDKTGPQPVDINGVWNGSMAALGGGTACLGFVVEGYWPDGSIKVQFVWNASDALRNAGTIRCVRMEIAEKSDGYHFRSEKSNYDLVLTRPGQLVGRCTTARQDIMIVTFDRDDKASSLASAAPNANSVVASAAASAPTASAQRASASNRAAR